MFGCIKIGTGYAKRCRLAALGGNDRAKLQLLQRICCRARSLDSQTTEVNMRIKLNKVYVDNQDKALKFYTEKLGFIKRTDIPVGKFRWIT
jgi:hypothetical protein